MIFAVSAFLTGCATNSELTQASDPVSVAVPTYTYPHYKRPNLVVRDIERALTIYRDVLGLTANEVAGSSANSFSYPVFNFPKTSQLRSVTLNEDAENRVMALTEVSGIDPQLPPNAPHMTAHVIGVTDLKGKIAKLASMGLETTHSKIAGGVEFRFIEQAFVDYDGHLIVLYEVLNDESDDNS